VIRDIEGFSYSDHAEHGQHLPRPVSSSSESRTQSNALGYASNHPPAVIPPLGLFRIQAIQDIPVVESRMCDNYAPADRQ
jgi:hypothetical protein